MYTFSGFSNTDKKKFVTNIAVRYLVIFIEHNKEQYYNFNCFKIYEDMDKLFNSWKKRK